MHLLLLNVGNSDVLANGSRAAPARVKGEQLWYTYEQHSFSFPIIEPCLAILLRTSSSRIDRLVLFDINQPARGAGLEADRNGIKLRDKDTIWFGMIIERWIKESYGERVGEVVRRDITTINPSLYDEAFEEYGRQLAVLYDPSVRLCSVLMAGGIPACNSALQLQSISRFGERCRTIYQPESGEAYELRTGRQVLAAFRQASAIDALSRHDFATALALLTPSAPADLLALLRFARDREAFDFAHAQMELEHGITAAGGDTRQFLLGLRHSLDDLVDREELGPLLLELHANARIAYVNGRYAGFLGRMFRFQEATLRLVVERIYSLPTDMQRSKRVTNQPLWQAGIAANPALAAYLASRSINGEPLTLGEPSIPVLTAMLAYAVDNKHGQRADGTSYLKRTDQERYRAVHKRLARFQNLSMLRNQSIIAHGFRGVSQAAIRDAYGADDPLEDMRTILNILGFSQQHSIYEQLAEFISEQLRRGI